MFLPPIMEDGRSTILFPRWKLADLPLSISLDPVSLITLFLDDAEKDLMHRSSDMTWVCCFGLFANPTTAWIEYGTLPPGQGLRYYNPQRGLTSTIEIGQVNSCVAQFADGRRDAGLIVRLTHQRPSIYDSTAEWLIIRPLILLGIVIVVGMSQDYIAMTAIISILMGQTLVVACTIKDRTTVFNVPAYDPIERNVFLLANNVTVIVESPSTLFVKACSSRGYKKMERPTMTQVLATQFFMIGVLLVGVAGLNSKIAYLVGHIVQAVLIALLNKRALKSRTLNSLRWEVYQSTTRGSIKRRREALLWASEHTSGNAEWLKLFNLADEESLAFIQTHQDSSRGTFKFVCLA
jgi:hypothetical protein